jgi:hypothetical protein
MVLLNDHDFLEGKLKMIDQAKRDSFAAAIKSPISFHIAYQKKTATPSDDDAL